MKRGAMVVYQGKTYIVVFVYGNGQCEIQTYNEKIPKVELVNVSDVVLVEQSDHE